MKIYQINTSAGEIMWEGTYTSAMNKAMELALKHEKMGVKFTYEITTIEVPLLKPDFLEWLNRMFGGHQNV